MMCQSIYLSRNLPRQSYEGNRGSYVSFVPDLESHNWDDLFVGVDYLFISLLLMSDCSHLLAV